jgi:hypothetical protein
MPARIWIGKHNDVKMLNENFPGREICRDEKGVGKSFLSGKNGLEFLS